MDKPQDLKSALAGKLNPKELGELITSYDRLGNLIIIEVPSTLLKKAKLIGETLLSAHPGVRTVCMKNGIHGGTYRTQKLKVIAGKRTKEADYFESGVKIRLHAEKVFFSPRLSSERLRIAKMVMPGERVLVMFSGCGPYQMVIGRAQKLCIVEGVELNAIGHKYAEINKELNRLSNVINHLGDVRKVVPKLGAFDRVIMALPKDAPEFLDVGLPAVKKGGIVHLYSFAHEEEFALEAARIVEICKGLGRIVKSTGVYKCGAYKPHVFRVCVDLICQ